MVASILARYDSKLIGINIQWTASELCEKLNKSLPKNSATKADLFVDTVALSHGLSLFQKQLNKMGLDAIIVSTKSKSVPDFFDLTGAQRTIEIKFSNYDNSSRPELEPFADLMARMVQIRNFLFLKNNYEPSPHSSPSSVFGNLFYPVLLKLLKKSADKKARTVRKSPSKLRQRAINLSANKLVNSIEEKFGEKDSLFYLQSAIKVAVVRKIKYDEMLTNSTHDEIENENREEEDSEEEEKEIANMITEDFENDERIIKAFTDLPRKYVLFGDEDRKNVIELFEIVREIAINRDYKDADFVSSSAVAKLLSQVPYYSQISERTMRRWYT